ncbi:DUF4902 domain-containing protein [Pragia fontium]|uniref:DUF4902 domain-containing protein n=1 Tax=Pragia fontium TaxID=82985 RepID=UPI000699BA0E|nr:DUF4902 domain-containing protein [Pragia fontium]
MQNKRDINKANSSGNNVIMDDLRVKVHIDFFEHIEFIHLHSAVYEEPANQHFLGGVATVINGYTEWVSQTSPVISMGWDWELRYENACCQYVKIGPIFSNVVFHASESTSPIQDEEAWTQQLLDNKIAQIEWQSKTGQYITQ